MAVEVARAAERAVVRSAGMARKTPKTRTPDTRNAVPVHRLKARLSHWMGRVRAGATVIATERGKPVARIDPVSPADDPAGVVATLVARGLARPPIAPLPPDFFTAPRPADPDGLLLAALLAEREESER
ncbi:MAG: type II toxin-antitoxin system prevent-host-death family antitoxin [Gemmataceae bacterium]